MNGMVSFHSEKDATNGRSCEGTKVNRPLGISGIAQAGLTDAMRKVHSAVGNKAKVA